MTNEEKQLLLKVLCAMSPYGVKGLHREQVHSITIMDAGGLYPSLQVDGYNAWFPIETFKPYLRPMSSMTEKEQREYNGFIFSHHHEWDGSGTHTEYVEVSEIDKFHNWLNAHHFDYRRLIPMGLALEAPEGMYNIE